MKAAASYPQKDKVSPFTGIALSLFFVFQITRKQCIVPFQITKKHVNRLFKKVENIFLGYLKDSATCKQTLLITRKHVNEYKKEPQNSVSSTFLMVKTVFRGLKLTQIQCYEVNN